MIWNKRPDAQKSDHQQQIQYINVLLIQQIWCLSTTVGANRVRKSVTEYEFMNWGQNRLLPVVRRYRFWSRNRVFAVCSVRWWNTENVLWSDLAFQTRDKNRNMSLVRHKDGQLDPSRKHKESMEYWEASKRLSNVYADAAIRCLSQNVLSGNSCLLQTTVSHNRGFQSFDRRWHHKNLLAHDRFHSDAKVSAVLPMMALPINREILSFFCTIHAVLPFQRDLVHKSHRSQCCFQTRYFSFQSQTASFIRRWARSFYCHLRGHEDEHWRRVEHLNNKPSWEFPSIEHRSASWAIFLWTDTRQESVKLCKDCDSILFACTLKMEHSSKLV